MPSLKQLGILGFAMVLLFAGGAVAAGPSLSATAHDSAVTPGNETQVNVTLTNTGERPYNRNITISLSGLNNGWSAQDQTEKVTLAPGNSTVVTIELAVPKNASNGTEVVTAKAISDGKTVASDSAQIAVKKSSSSGAIWNIDLGSILPKIGGQNTNWINADTDIFNDGEGNY